MQTIILKILNYYKTTDSGGVWRRVVLVGLWGVGLIRIGLRGIGLIKVGLWGVGLIRVGLRGVGQISLIPALIRKMSAGWVVLWIYSTYCGGGKMNLTSSDGVIRGFLNKRFLFNRSFI